MAKIVDGHCSECKAFQPHPGELVEKKGDVGTKHVGCWNCSAPFEDVEQAQPESVEDLKAQLAAVKARLQEAEGEGRLEKKGEEPTFSPMSEQPSDSTAKALPSEVEAASAPAAPRLYPQKHTEKRGPGRSPGR